jgi:hypothetical protein
MGESAVDRGKHRQAAGAVCEDKDPGGLSTVAGVLGSAEGRKSMALNSISDSQTQADLNTPAAARRRGIGCVLCRAQRQRSGTLSHLYFEMTTVNYFGGF